MWFFALRAWLICSASRTQTEIATTLSSRRNPRHPHTDAVRQFRLSLARLL